MATTITTKNIQNNQRRGGVKLKEFIYICITHWPWFMLSIVLCMGIAWLYLKKTPPTYVRTSWVMIKTDNNGNTMSSQAAMFQDLGLSNSYNTIINEIQVLKSPDLMQDVVRRLNLDMNYSVPGRFRDEVLYGSSLPVTVTMPDLPDEASASFRLNLKSNGDFTMSDIFLNGRDLNRGEISGRLGVPVKTPLGNVTVNPAGKFDSKDSFEINVSRIPPKALAKGMAGSLEVVENLETSNILEMSYKDVNPERAADIVTELKAAYDARWMKEKREAADNSSKFIDERISLLQQELGNVDNDISSFKSSHLLPNVDAAANIYMNQATQSSAALRDLRNQEYMAKYIRNYLHTSENNHKLLPSNSGLTNPAISGMIAQYNTKILERNSLVSQSSTSNPLVTEMDAQLSAMRQALVASIDNEVVAITEQIRSQEGLSGQATSRIASNPQQAKYLLSVERQQKVKETLYLYLLQKREENQLNQAISSYNTRLIRETDGPDGPIAPLGTQIMTIAGLIGLFLPMAILYLKELSVSVVRGRKDIKQLNIPFAGELPFNGKKDKSFKTAGHHKEYAQVAVKENSRNAINEAFRVIRTNIEFMNGSGSAAGSQAIMLTSANPGSGKTFVTYNLAKSFSIKNKKVVAIDLDLRKASLSKYVSECSYGISDYLANRVNNIDSIIVPVDDAPNMSIIPVGTLPPNPTELLFSDRLNALIQDLRNHYDYIFIDCPPVEVVADSTIISKYADSTLFVIRAGLLRLDMLPVIEEYYSKGSYPNMSVILNGTINPTSRYARRYGNPYSYGYGYGSIYTYSHEK